MNEIKENVRSEYAFNEKIYIHSGFYKGYNGIIQDFNPKSNLYIIKVKLNENSFILISSNSDSLNKVKKWFK